MKKLASFLVDKRYVVLILILILAVISAMLIPQVEVNNDMTKYLAEDSPMRQGLNIMEDEFPDSDSEQSIRVMFTGLSEEEKADVLSELEVIENVDSVDYDSTEDYNKDNYTLFVLNMTCEYSSKQEAAITDSLENTFVGYTMCYKNNDTLSTNIPTWVIVSAVSIMLVILLIMSGSWFEPVLFLTTIAIAIVINMGTNIVLDSIADITSSIAAILQLVLSMDYSIILMNRYRQERKLTEDKKSAMKNALNNSFGSISSSSMTTVVGLLMLIFMSFTIGFDLGIVIAKGVFVSMICVFTVLPSLIILCDKILLKTEKKQHSKKESSKTAADVMSGFSQKARYVVLGVFIALFVGMSIFQSYTPINYTQDNPDEIADVFPLTNTIVMLYNNEDETAVERIAEEVKTNEYVKNISSYGETLGKSYKASELVDMLDSVGSDMDLDPSLISIVYYDYFDGDLGTLKADKFFSFLIQMAQSPEFSGMIDSDSQQSIARLAMFSDKQNLTESKTSTELATFFGMDEQMVDGMIAVYNMQSQMQELPEVETLSVKDFINLAMQMAASPEAGLDEATAAQLTSVQVLTDAVVSEKDFTASEMYELIGSLSPTLTENTIELMYLVQTSSANSDSEWELSLLDFIGYINNDILNDSRFEGLISDKMKASIEEICTQLEDGAAQLKGDNYSRIIFNTTLPEESDETTAFINDLTEMSDAGLQNDYYLIGSSAMNYEMANSFESELHMITLLTVLAIFLIVAISFRNLIIPIILVLLVQCGVYITVSVLHFVGVYFLALLIVECILMGATIDYGILFTNYYRENRETVSEREAVKKSFEGAMHTILTSGLILIIVTGIIGFLSEGTMSQICLAISIGTLSAATLILLVVPSLLMIFDKAVMFRIGSKNKNT